MDYGDYGYDYGAAAGFSTGILIFYLVIAVLMIASYWKIFDKAGQPGWAAIVPIYNIIVLLQVIKRPVWWIILFLIPFVNVIMAILIAIDLAKAFGKDTGFALGLIFIPIVFYPILAFGNAEYTPEALGRE